VSNIDKALDLINQLKDVLLAMKKPPAAPQVLPEAPPLKIISGGDHGLIGISDDFEGMKKLLLSDDWPQACDPYLICDTDSATEMQIRGENVVNYYIDQPLKGLKFLDVYCGQGYIPYAASETAALAVGYGPMPEKPHFYWDDKKGNLLLTDSIEKVQENGPYDVICLYDTVDHLEEPELGLLLEQLEKWSRIGTQFYVRCHPWYGRHGGHLYRKINKAFVHLLFSEEELIQLGFPLAGKLNKALSLYRLYPKYFSNLNKSGHFIRQKIMTETVEDFFKQNDLVGKRIGSIWQGQFPYFQMSQTYVDYRFIVNNKVADKSKKEDDVTEHIKEVQWFLYRRVGHEERLLEFLPNHQFGQGGDACEQRWKVENGNLQIFGNMGLTCSLTFNKAQYAWTGKWNIFEQCPIKLFEL